LTDVVGQCDPIPESTDKVLTGAKMETEKLPRLLKLQEVSDRCSISRSQLHRVIKAGDLKAVHIGRAIRVVESEMERWIISLPLADHLEQK